MIVGAISHSIICGRQTWSWSQQTLLCIPGWVSSGQRTRYPRTHQSGKFWSADGRGGDGQEGIIPLHAYLASPPRIWKWNGKLIIVRVLTRQGQGLGALPKSRHLIQEWQDCLHKRQMHPRSLWSSSFPIHFQFYSSGFQQMESCSCGESYSLLLISGGGPRGWAKGLFADPLGGSTRAAPGLALPGDLIPPKLAMFHLDFPIMVLPPY